MTKDKRHNVPDITFFRGLADKSGALAQISIVVISSLVSRYTVSLMYIFIICDHNLRILRFCCTEGGASKPLQIKNIFRFPPLVGEG